MAQAIDYARGIHISGPLTIPSLGVLEKEVLRLLGQTAAEDVQIDLDGVTELDTAGVVFVEQLPNIGARANRSVVVGPMPERLRPFQEFLLVRTRTPLTALGVAPGAVESVGNWVRQVNASLVGLLYLASDLSWAAISAVFHRSGIRRGALIEQAVALGSSALPIIALIIFLIGAVSSLQAAAQLRKFGADIFVAELLAIGITRELGPLMTAIIVAGRSGSAIAAEVATMKFTEELDALETMSLDPLRYVAVPKLWAMVICLPMLTIMADFVGILGGVVVGITVMGIAPEAFINQLVGALFVRDVLSGLVKSFSFAWAITVVGVYNGLRYSGGAAGVGRSTTAAVVASIFVIIVLDSFWGVVFYLG
jgi:phospholipid/cholesterol/gamma-HCH transport system permease protein